MRTSGYWSDCTRKGVFTTSIVDRNAAFVGSACTCDFDFPLYRALKCFNSLSSKMNALKYLKYPIRYLYWTKRREMNKNSSLEIIRFLANENCH